MMLIVRLYPKQSIQRVWDYVEENISEDTKGIVTPLYASQTEGKMEVSVIVDAEKPDDIISLLTENIANCEDIHHTKTVPLIKPVFFPVPRKKPSTLYRYTLHIYAHPFYYKELYNYLIQFNYPKNLIPIYGSYSLGEEDIIMVMMADSHEVLDQFVRKKIRTMDGVEAAVFHPVVKTKRFASLSKLKEYGKKHFTQKGKEIPDKDIDWEYDWTFEEYARITGAFSRDI